MCVNWSIFNVVSPAVGVPHSASLSLRGSEDEQWFSWDGGIQKVYVFLTVGRAVCRSTCEYMWT